MIYDILAQEKPERVVIHCFGGTVEQAKKFAELNCYLGITGVVTFKKSEILQNIVRQLPLQNLVIETDSPYLTPEPFRGKRNQSSYVQYVAEKIAELRGEEFEVIAKETTNNARRLYVI
jgi:TatD DNase family protein